MDTASILFNRSFLIYLLKFILGFCAFYFGSKAIIGLAVPDDYYSRIVDEYFDIALWLRASLIYATKLVLHLAGYATVIPDDYSIKILNGRAVRIVFSCLGFGVMSFWCAFIIANSGGFFKKLKWVAGGLFLIWLINLARISLLLLAINKRWFMPLGLNHHTWFNITAYTCIFILIYFYDKSQRTTEPANR